MKLCIKKLEGRMKNLEIYCKKELEMQENDLSILVKLWIP